jgi:hypothetical protein
MNQTALNLAVKIAGTFAPRFVSVEKRRDTDFPDAPECYVINEQLTGALVVYFDEPDTIVGTGNRAGRFVVSP